MINSSTCWEIRLPVIPGKFKIPNFIANLLSSSLHTTTKTDLRFVCNKQTNKKTWWTLGNVKQCKISNKNSVRCWYYDSKLQIHPATGEKWLLLTWQKNHKNKNKNIGLVLLENNKYFWWPRKLIQYFSEVFCERV